MSFLSPLFLVGAVAAAVPIVLHLLKREPEPRVKFAFVRLLRQAPVEDTEKHRLRELLLLALRVATLVLLALAFARPFFATGAAARSAGATIVALDTSASMSAPGRFERARQLAREALDRASGDLVGVVTFADEADVAARPTSDRVLAAAAIDRAAPGFGATRYRSGLATASEQLMAATGGRGTIVIVTDLQASGWDEGDRAAVPADARVQVVDAGELPPNIAVTAARALNDRIVATVHNSGPRGRDVRAHLTIDGRAAGDATASLGPDDSGDVVFPVTPRGLAASVTVDDPGGNAADDVRYVALAGSVRPSVLLVTSNGSAEHDAFYVQRALAAGSRSAYDVAVTSGAQLSADDKGSSRDRLGAHTAVIVLSTRGLERRGREALAEYVHGGGGLLLAAGPDVDGEVSGDILGGGNAIRIAPARPQASDVRTLAPADIRHPVFRPFVGASAPLAFVRFRNTAAVDGTQCQTLARFSSGDKALLECGAGDGRALVLASDLDNRWNDFPLHASFVPFLHEAVRYLSSAHTHAANYAVGDAPAGVPRRPGVYPIRSGSNGAERRVAVNVDPREADASRLTIEEFQAAVTHLQASAVPAARREARQQEDTQHLWQYALALMAITLAIEGVVASRTA
jgi:von Willebrand factor type A domain/Aerotolerance regulator N-terminal